jgi:hypothetical protein
MPRNESVSDILAPTIHCVYDVCYSGKSGVNLKNLGHRRNEQLLLAGSSCFEEIVYLAALALSRSMM